MSWTDPDLTLFEDGDQWTEPNIKTHILDNLYALAHPLEAPTSADLDVTNTVAETTLYSVTVPANALGTNGELLMEIFGDARGTAGGNSGLTVRAKFGGTTHVTAIRDYVNNTVRNAAIFQVRVMNQGAANAQLVYLSASDEGPDSGGPVAIGHFLPVAAAIDTTVDQALSLTLQWSVAQATNSVRRLWARTLIGKN